jgi:hypothetical protein
MEKELPGAESLRNTFPANEEAKSETDSLDRPNSASYLPSIGSLLKLKRADNGRLARRGRGYATKSTSVGADGWIERSTILRS